MNSIKLHSPRERERKKFIIEIDSHDHEGWEVVWSAIESKESLLNKDVVGITSPASFKRWLQPSPLRPSSTAVLL